MTGVDVGGVGERPAGPPLHAANWPVKHPVAVAVDRVVGARPEPRPVAVQVAVCAHVAGTLLQQ